MSALKQLLDEKYIEILQIRFFYRNGPIQIPKLFEEKEDIEIAGSWRHIRLGQRPSNYQKMQELMKRVVTLPMTLSSRDGCRLLLFIRF